MSESYFFACIPRYLRVEHSFAKSIKPNTKYRISIYKGIQKSDEMKQGIKSKIVGGKIDLESPELFFNVAFYNPTKNILFTLKLFEQRPNQEEEQIGSFSIMSSDYIRLYKTENQVLSQVQGMLKDDLFCYFDLIVEKSKFSLTDALKKFAIPTSRSGKQVFDDNKSQSSQSKQAVRQGEGFSSPMKKIERKNGRIGKLRSRNSSRSDGGQNSPQGSVASSARKWQRSPASRQQDKFLTSPKRLSRNKIQQKQPKSIPKSDKSLKSNEAKVQTQSAVNKKTYQYQPYSNLKVSETVSQNKVEKPQVARSNVVSPSGPRNYQSPVSQSGVRQPPSQSSAAQPFSPRSPTQISSVRDNSFLPTSPKSMIQSASQATKTPIKPSQNPKNQKVELQFKHTQKIFDIVKKKESVTEVKNEKGSEKPKIQQDNKQVKEQKTNQKIIEKKDKSEKTFEQIQVKDKQVKRIEKLSESRKVREPSRVIEAPEVKKADQESINAEKLTAQRKVKIYYGLFLIISVYLIYQAMMPTRRT